VSTLREMPSRPEIARLLDGLATDDQFLLRGVLESEVPESDPLVLVDCGDERRSLMRVVGPALVFYFVTGRRPGQADGHELPQIRTTRVVAPRRARISEEREVRAAGAVEGSEQYPLATRLGGGAAVSHSVTATTMLVAEHEAFPGGSIRCDCSQLAPDQRTRVRDLFESWAQPRSQR
jgi:hypothetical protein